MAVRKFDKFLEHEKLYLLFHKLSMALRESDDHCRKWRTDVYGIAIQYGGKKLGIKKSDFDKLKKMTVEEIVDLVVKFKKALP